MKLNILSFLAFVVFTTTCLAQTGKKAEVLYFKANLSCCQAKSCDALEGDVKKVIESKFSGKNVVFKEVKLSDAANAEMVKKFNAKSQTVVIVVNKNGKESISDVSKILKDYNLSKDYAKFEKDLMASINTSLK
jgi:hypothetical protein